MTAMRDSDAGIFKVCFCLSGLLLGASDVMLPLLVVAVFAPTGARLTVQDVTVLQLPSVCDQQDSSTAAVVSSDAQLLAALADGDISTVLVTADITLHSGTWQVGSVCKPQMGRCQAVHCSCPLGACNLRMEFWVLPTVHMLPLCSALTLDLFACKAWNLHAKQWILR